MNLIGIFDAEEQVHLGRIFRTICNFDVDFIFLETYRGIFINFHRNLDIRQDGIFELSKNLTSTEYTLLLKNFSEARFVRICK